LGHSFSSLSAGSSGLGLRQGRNIMATGICGRGCTFHGSQEAEGVTGRSWGLIH
jgi:hypothetical protein